MTVMKRSILAATILAAFGLNGAMALPRTSLAPGGGFHVPVQMGLFELFVDDDSYVHDQHYDWNQYRNATSRKERIRDYYLMQKEAEKDYWRAQKNMQKNMIKRQRGW
ncbi:hypothetical protein [Microvirga sp. 2TAF3]|uniref:hypothetical protein n=1 Tax=Microvirga sp. 2TAF3 TaxID=3233014 RepID=UPI003F967BF2